MKQPWVLAAVLWASCSLAAAQPAATAAIGGLAPPPVVSSAAAAVVPPQQASAPVQAPPGDIEKVTAGTMVEIELAEPVSSETAHRGDKFAIRLAAPIMVDQRLVVPAGATGGGEVVFSEAAGILGKPGTLVLAARYIDFAGQRLPLRAFRLGAGGHDNSNAVFVADVAVSAVAGVFGLVTIVIPGGNIKFPVGTLANAKLASDVTVSDAPPPTPALALSQTPTLQKAAQ